MSKKKRRKLLTEQEDRFMEEHETFQVDDSLFHAFRNSRPLFYLKKTKKGWAVLANPEDRPERLHPSLQNAYISGILELLDC